MRRTRMVRSVTAAMVDEQLRKQIEAAVAAKLETTVTGVIERWQVEKAKIDEERRRREAKIDEERRLREEDEERKRQAAAQVEADRKERRFNNILRYVVGPALLTAVGGTGYSVYDRATKPGAAEIDTAIEQRFIPIETAIEGCPREIDANNKVKACSKVERDKSIRGTAETNSKKADRLGDLHYETLRVIVDAQKENRAMLRAVTKRVDNVEAAPAVQNAAEAVEAHDELKRQRLEKAKADEAIKKGDPFAGL